MDNDTVYSIASVDLSVGPVVLHVPDTADRYRQREAPEDETGFDGSYDLPSIVRTS